MVGAIHGRLLTAWSIAGIFGPVIVNYRRESLLAQGIPPEQVYNQTMYILAGLLIVGLICNLLVRPVASKWFMTDEELAEEKRLAHERAQMSKEEELTFAPSGGGVAVATSPAMVLLAWLAVGAPLAWGVWKTLQKALALFA
jgi:hypothetical protein